MSFADRLELPLFGTSHGPDADVWCDVAIAGLADEWSLEVLREASARLGAEGDARLAGLAPFIALLARYEAGEFDPPPEWFLPKSEDAAP
jgi:hypothetical protein